MTRAEIRTRILRAVNDPDGVFLPTATANALIGEAADFLAEHRSPVMRRLVLPLKPYWTYYRLTAFAADCILPVRLYNATTGRTIEPCGLDELDALRHKWEETTGDPTRWASRGWSQIALYPCPVTAQGLVYVDYLAWPQTLLHDEASPPFSEGDQEALFLYGWAEALARGNDSASLPAAWKRLMAVVSPEAAARGLRIPWQATQRERANGNGTSTA